MSDDAIPLSQHLPSVALPCLRPPPISRSSSHGLTGMSGSSAFTNSSRTSVSHNLHTPPLTSLPPPQPLLLPYLSSPSPPVPPSPPPSPPTTATPSSASPSGASAAASLTPSTRRPHSLRSSTSTMHRLTPRSPRRRSVTAT